MHTDTNDTITRTTINGCNVVYRGTPPAWLLEGLAGDKADRPDAPAAPDTGDAQADAERLAWLIGELSGEPDGTGAPPDKPDAPVQDTPHPDWTYFAEPLHVEGQPEGDGTYRLRVGEAVYRHVSGVVSVGAWTHYSDGRAHLLIEDRDRFERYGQTLVRALDADTTERDRASLGLDAVRVKWIRDGYTTSVVHGDARVAVGFSPGIDYAAAQSLLDDGIAEWRRARLVADRFGVGETTDASMSVEAVGLDRAETVRHLAAVAEYMRRVDMQGGGTVVGDPSAPPPAPGVFDDDIPF